MVYVSNSGDNTVSVIDGRINSLEKTVTVGKGTMLLAVNPNAHSLRFNMWLEYLIHLRIASKSLKACYYTLKV
jgi:YVTN family beta-propeller protein